METPRPARGGTRWTGGAEGLGMEKDGAADATERVAGAVGVAGKER